MTPKNYKGTILTFKNMIVPVILLSKSPLGQRRILKIQIMQGCTSPFQ